MKLSRAGDLGKRIPLLVGVPVLAMVCAGLANAQTQSEPTPPQAPTQTPDASGAEDYTRARVVGTAVLDYGGLTFGESTPADMTKVTGEFKGCNDEPHVGLKDATVCTVVASTTSPTGPSNIVEKFIFGDGLLREVTLTAREEATFKDLASTVAKRFSRIRPPVYLFIADERRIVITSVEGRIAWPKLVSRVEPAYPEAVRKQRLEGVVIIEAVIAKDGTVEDAKTLQTPFYSLGSLAVAAVKQWRYEPARLDGAPVRLYLTVTTTFRLNSGPKL